MKKKKNRLKVNKLLLYITSNSFYLFNIFIYKLNILKYINFLLI